MYITYFVNIVYSICKITEKFIKKTTQFLADFCRLKKERSKALKAGLVEMTQEARHMLWL